MIDVAAERDAWLVDHPERPLSVGGRRWGVIDIPATEPRSGDAPVDPGADAPPEMLLLLPGSLGRADILWRVMSRLAGPVPMRSVTYPATPDMLVWCDDLLRMLDRAKVERAAVFGVSLGGYLAQHFAGRYPDRVSRLMVGSTVASVEALERTPPYSGDPSRTSMALVREGFGRGLQDWAVRHPGQADVVAMLLAETRGRIPARQMRARLMALRHAPPAPSRPLPSARVSVIETLDDPVIAAADREGLRASLRPGTVYRFLEGGHHAFIIRPDLYAAAMAEGLGLAPPGRGPWGVGALRVR